MADQVLVTLDGAVRDADAPLLRADDLAAVRGDGIFETILVRDGAACVVERHLSRFANSASMLDLPRPDLAAWRSAIAIALGEWGAEREGAMRLVLSRGRESGGGPTAYVSVGPVADRVAVARRDGVSVCTLDRGFSVDVVEKAPWLLLGAKTLSYATNMAALRYAQARDFDDVIFTSSEGRVLEGPRSTVLIARGRTLITPPVEHGILPGTTQQALFEVAGAHRFRCEMAALRPVDLIAADGIWLLSSVTLAARVHTLDGLVLPVPAIADELSELVDLAVGTVGVEEDAA
ncbi:4-amino-4-deoxychorismate lyase [Rhodococcus sp. RD6.2]|uniref:aminodeoxychorismate lyase n=1 Tax=Rhodococcus sp. RD6.2 TaxID=260936 RepID=UPI00063BA1A0|nr:aminodeoxychorismate lyase [Rhodococcus sp. RD6.2]CRK53465.1 4-amino-4-deoxychorismate lyase [Rhodococcus sp. RD6.2]